MTPISANPITTQSIQSMPSIESISSGDSGSFKNFMLDALDQVNDLQKDADHAVEELFTGGEVSTAEVLTAVQKADMSFKLMMQIRNKLVQAYQEIQQVRI